MPRSTRCLLLLTATLVAAPALALAAPDDKPAAPVAAPAPAVSLAVARARAAASLAEFNAVDTNDDGRVSSSEHEVYARTLFDALDTDGDYKLTVAEIMAGPDKFFRHVSAGGGGMLGNGELTPLEKIQRIDANRDGVVSRDEQADAARAKYRTMDGNNNGELTPEEFATGG